MRRCSWSIDGDLLSEERLDITADTACEKNWLPFVDGGRQLAVYWHDPFLVIDLETFEVVAKQPMSAVDLSGFRGSSAPVSWKQGWLYTVHEVCERELEGKRCYFYMHRFCWMDAKYLLRHFSQLFYLDQLGVEFCCGMVLYGNGVALTFGVLDNAAKIALIEADTIDAALGQNTIN